MPELPEVEALVFELSHALTNQTIESVEVRGPAVLQTPRREMEEALPGKTIVRIARRGKYIQIELSSGRMLWLHLGMTGQLFFESSFSPDGHTHLILSFASLRQRLFYRDVRKFGRITLVPSGNRTHLAGVARLGLEPNEWDRQTFVSELKGRRGRIKNLLLNQKLISGLGNIYADESLYRAGIHPLRRAFRVPRERLLRLHKAMGEVLEEAVRWGGSSIDDYRHLDGTRGRFQEFHRVYGRKGERCRTCGTVIRKIWISGRGSSFCPRCQR